MHWNESSLCNISLQHAKGTFGHYCKWSSWISLGGSQANLKQLSLFLGIFSILSKSTIVENCCLG